MYSVHVTFSFPPSKVIFCTASASLLESFMSKGCWAGPFTFARFFSIHPYKFSVQKHYLKDWISIGGLRRGKTYKENQKRQT